MGERKDYISLIGLLKKLDDKEALLLLEEYLKAKKEGNNDKVNELAGKISRLLDVPLLVIEDLDEQALRDFLKWRFFFLPAILEVLGVLFTFGIIVIMVFSANNGPASLLIFLYVALAIV
ncbi:MAG: hypothetical protein ACPLRS_02150, partial [Hydrogenobacter sp.]